MMRLPRFRYLAPRTLDDAAAMLADAGPDAMLVAGGTDLFPNMKRRQQTPRTVIGLRAVADLHATAVTDTGAATLGAMMTLTDLEQHPDINKVWPALAAAARSISTPPLRNMGTLGGNICLDTRCNYYDQNYEWRKAINFCMKREGSVCWVAPSSPRCWAVSSTDTVPVLIAIGAEVSLIERNGGANATERRIPIAELFNDDGIQYLTKKPTEVVAKVHLPANDGWRTTYHKLRRRDSFDFPVLGVAASLKLDGNGAVAGARLVIGGVGSKPHDESAAAQPLIGQRPTPELIEQVAQTASHTSRPLDNTDFVHGWRKKMTRVYVTRALTELATGA